LVNNQLLTTLIQENVLGKIALATDAWTSTNGHAFLSLVASWVTDDWKVAECVVDFAELHGSHDGKNLANAIFNSLKTKSLIPKVCHSRIHKHLLLISLFKFLSLTGDNASNNGSMVKELIDLINLERPDTATPLEKDKVTIRCLPHVLHLAVTDLMKGIKSLAEDEELDIGADILTEDDAERLHAERMAGKENEEDDESELSDVDLAYAILKVSDQFHPTLEPPANLSTRFGGFQKLCDHLRSARNSSERPFASY
jgi:hypothetical protein